MTHVLAPFCVLIVAVSLLGGVLPLATVLNHTRLQMYLSFSAGTMLGAAFFHMLPEAVRWVRRRRSAGPPSGLLSLFFLERFFSFHHHEPRESRPGVAHEASDHDHDHGGHHHEHGPGCGRHMPRTGTPECRRAIGSLSWWTAAFGLAVHSLVGGVALASAIAADFAGRKALGATGWGVFLATVVHKPADALTIVSLMLRSGVSSRLGAPGQSWLRADDPPGRRPLRAGTRTASARVTPRSGRPSRSVLRGDVPLHRPERPACPSFSSTRTIGSSSRWPCWPDSSSWPGPRRSSTSDSACSSNEMESSLLHTPL